MPALLTLPRSPLRYLWLAVPPLAALPALALEPKWSLFYVGTVFVALPIALTIRDAKLWAFVLCLLSGFNFFKVIADPIPGADDSLAIAAVDVPILITLGVALARASSGGAVKIRLTAAARTVLLVGALFLGWATFGAVLSAEPEIPTIYLLTYLRMLLGLAVLAACANDASRLRWGLYGFFLALVLQSGLAAIQYATGSSFGLYHHFEEETARGFLVRAGGTLNPTVLSEFIGVVVPLALAVSFTARRRVVALGLLGVFGAGTLASVLTFSRAGLASIGLSSLIVIAVAFMSPAVPRQRKVVVGVAVAAVACALAVYFAASLGARVSAVSDEVIGEESRWSQMQQAARMIADNPVTGVGLGLYRFAMGRYGPVLSFPVHNKYLGVASETGLPGVALYVGMWLTALWAFVRQARARQGAEQMFFAGAAAALVATLANMNTDVYGTGGAPELALFLLVGLGLGYMGKPAESPALEV